MRPVTSFFLICLSEQLVETGLELRVSCCIAVLISIKQSIHLKESAHKNQLFMKQSKNYSLKRTN